MKSVRRFFGTLCGGSGNATDANKDASPYDQPKDVEPSKDQQEEPTITASNIDSKNERSQLSNLSLAKSSYDSLNESPSIRHQQKVIDAACSVSCIYDVSEWNPENLGVNQVDQVFQDAKKILEPFIKHCQTLSSLLLSFARQYSRDKKPDFRKCYQVYVRNKSTYDQNESQMITSRSADTAELDLEDPTMKELKTIADSSKQLLNMIESIRPKIDEKLAEASTHNVKDSGKEKEEDGAHKGLLSKFSAPGKYRRNMKHLRENRKLLDLIYCEVESIVKTIEKHKDTTEADQFDQEAAYQERLEEFGSRTLLSLVADEAPVCQEELKVEAEAKLDLEALPEPEPHPVVMDPKSPGQHSSSENEVLLDEGHKRDEDKKNAGHNTGTVTETSVVNDVPVHVVDGGNSPVHKHDDNEQERYDVIEPLRPTSPLSLRSKRSDSFEGVDFGKLLDFGSYIVVDPSAQDEVVLRRSRSLDSLCSVTSRKTMSRYGSYEFVTDFEINIAEKAENDRQKTAFLKQQLADRCTPQPCLSCCRFCRNMQRNFS
ncbi:uncharacterized protein LOC135686752 isoform X2 [Rhopilema esculentum]|uniref:uncharacterized protein LOC135686752 isoform X2 n=1 Tax=Rhopilema esculentum TaxID=499914 RepID=UPI0031D059D2